MTIKVGRPANKNLRTQNQNEATDFLWVIIDTYFKGNIAKCAKEIGLSRQRLSDILGHYNLLPPAIFLRFQHYLEKEKNMHIGVLKWQHIINCNRFSQHDQKKYKNN